MTHGFFYDMGLDGGEVDVRRPIYDLDDVWYMILLRLALNCNFQLPAFPDEAHQREILTAMRDHGLIENEEDELDCHTRPLGLTEVRNEIGTLQKRRRLSSKQPQPTPAAA